MSCNIENENDWIEKAIENNFLKFYEYKHFSNIEKIGSGAFGRVYRANFENSNQYVALKDFISLNDSALKEIVHEVIIKYNTHDAIHSHFPIMS
jgi:hypothetical protein